MKKIGVFILLAAALTSCYDEYVKDYVYDGFIFLIRRMSGLLSLVRG